MNITVVTGPPCAGKSTHIHQHRDSADLVIDLDHLAQAFGYPTDHIDYGTKHPAITAALIARASILKRLPSIATDAWVVATDPTTQLPYPADYVHLDPGQQECHDRVTPDRAASTHDQIDRWYDQYADSGLTGAASWRL